MIKTLIKGLGLVKDFGSAKEWLGKRWFLSKVLWMNAIAFASLHFLPQYGFEITMEEQASLLVSINMLMRFLTKQPLVMKEENIVNIQECEAANEALKAEDAK